MRTCLAILLSCLWCTSLFAVSSSYPVDSDTLHLWHLDVQVDGQFLDMAPVSPKNLNAGGGAVLVDSLAGFGSALNTYNGNVAGGQFAGDDVTPVVLSELIGADGAFTFEAIVKPMVAQGTSHHMEIICLEDNDGAEERGFQFRINDNGQLRFQTIAGIVVAFDANISYAVDTWYHVAVSYNGQEATADNLKLYWTEMGSATVAQEVGSYQLDQDLRSTVSSFFSIGNELRANGGYTENFEGLIDEVRISSIARATDDMILRESIPWANNPAPTPGEMLESLDSLTELQWDAADVADISKHYLYISKDEPNFANATPVIVNDLTNPITTPLSITLESDSYYFWRVDESINNSLPLDGETITGPVWTFETPPAIPVITNQPQPERAFATDPVAQITCVFTSLSTPTVQWFKDNAETPLPAAGDVSFDLTSEGNTYTATLSIATPIVSDEGEYSCMITNSADTIESDNGYLVISRLLAQYDFEGDLTATAGEADAPTGMGKSLAGQDEPNEPSAIDVTLAYETGYNGEGQAVIIGEGEFVDFGVEGYPKAGQVDGGLGLGLDAGTIVCWVKPTTEGILFQNFNDGGVTGISLSLETGSDSRIYLRSETGEIGLALGHPDRPAWDIYDGQWHMFAYTWELGKTMTVYVDGQPVATDTTVNTNTPFNPWQYSVLLGAGRIPSNRQFLQPEFATSVDALRIYNYRLDDQSNDVFAQEYLDATGLVPCLNSNFVGSEFNFDNTGSSYCTIDLADFAIFAASWMESGLYVAQ